MVSSKFYPWLNAELKKADISNNELARRAGVSSATVSLVLSRQRTVTADLCIRIASALNIPTTQVLKRAGFSVVADAPDGVTGQVAEGLRILQGLSGDRLTLAVRMLKAIES